MPIEARKVRVQTSELTARWRAIAGQGGRPEDYWSPLQRGRQQQPGARTRGASTLLRTCVAMPERQRRKNHVLERWPRPRPLNYNMATPARPGVARQSIMDRKWLCLLGIVAATAGPGAQQFGPGGRPAIEAPTPQRWLGPADRNLTTDGSVFEVPL